MQRKNMARLTSAMAVALALAGPVLAAAPGEQAMPVTGGDGAAAGAPGQAAAPGEQPSALPHIANEAHRYMVGLNVQNMKGAKLGTIRNVIVTPSGKITDVVLASGGVLGIGEDLYQVPWQRVHWAPNMDYVLIDVDKDKLKAEFSAFEPSVASEPRKDTE